MNGVISVMIAIYSSTEANVICHQLVYTTTSSLISEVRTCKSGFNYLCLVMALTLSYEYG